MTAESRAQELLAHVVAGGHGKAWWDAHPMAAEERKATEAAYVAFWREEKTQAAEPVGAVLERSWPRMIDAARHELSAQFMRREIDWKTLLACWPKDAAEPIYRATSPQEHLAWVRRAVASLDILAADCKGENLAELVKLRQDLLDFGGAAEGASNG